MTQAMALIKKPDLGEPIFVTDFFVALGLTALLTIVGAGLHFAWLTVAVGVVYFLFLCFLADRLYAGWPLGRVVSQGWTALQAVLTVGFAVLLGTIEGEDLPRYGLPGEAGTWSLFLLFATHLVFGLVLLSPRVRVFLGHRRGETSPEPVASAPSPVAVVPQGPVWAAADGGWALETQPKAELAQLALTLRLTAWAMLGLAGLSAAGFVALLLNIGGGWGLIPVAAVAGLLGLVLWTTGDDVDYLAKTKGSEVPHLSNIRTDVSVLSGVLAIAILVGVVFLLIGFATA